MSNMIIPLETTLRVRDHCLCLHAQRAARALARRFDLAMKPLGLTSGQFSLLMSLNRPMPAPMRSVAEVLGMNRTTLTANLKPLERRGLVTSARDPADARGRLLSLTDQGIALLSRAVPVWEATHAEAEAQLDGAAEAVRAGMRALG